MLFRSLNSVSSYSMCVHAQSCLTLCDPMDCSLQGFPVHGISQARILQKGPGLSQGIDHLRGLDHLRARDHLRGLDHLRDLYYLRRLDHLRGWTISRRGASQGPGPSQWTGAKTRISPRDPSLLPSVNNHNQGCLDSNHNTDRCCYFQTVSGPGREAQLESCRYFPNFRSDHPNALQSCSV